MAYSYFLIYLFLFSNMQKSIRPMVMYLSSNRDWTKDTSPLDEIDIGIGRINLF